MRNKIMQSNLIQYQQTFELAKKKIPNSYYNCVLFVQKTRSQIQHVK